MAKTKRVKEIEPVTFDDLLEKHDGVLYRGSDSIFQYTRISFGIPALDRLVGGGIPRKRLTLLTGHANAGKTYLASQIVARAQREGCTTAWLDNELSWDTDWMRKCGVDVDKIIVAQPMTGEDTFNIMQRLLESGVGVIVLDSVAGLVPAVFSDEAFSYNPVAWQARMVNQSIPRIMPYLKHNTALVWINQLRSGVGPVSSDRLPGGEGQSYFAHFRLQVRRAGWIEEDNKKIGFDMEISCRKTKVGGEYQGSCTIPFRVDGGFDLLETAVREAMVKELIIQSGPWYQLTWNDEKILGLNGVRQYLLANTSELDKLKTLVL